MLSLFGAGGRLCDGITRRDALRLGTLSVGGLTLPGMLRAERAAGIQRSQKSVIMIYMCGAPSHQDMYDLKMDAPSEIRGEFRPIASKVPGIEICEHLQPASLRFRMRVGWSQDGAASGAALRAASFSGRGAAGGPSRGRAARRRTSGALGRGV